MNKITRIYLIILLITGSFSLYFCTNSESNRNAGVASFKSKTEAPYSVKNTKVVPENAIAKKTSITASYQPSLVIPGRKMQSAVFEPGMSKTIGLEGAALTVPSGALKQIKSLSVTGLMSEDLPPIPAEITNVTKNYQGYRFLPHGMVFNSVATISMAYDESLIPEGFTKDDIYTYYFDETDHKWKALERDSINHESRLIVSNTLHFTDMINGIVKVPESPETAGYAPTSIKDIKAADPTAGISLIAPPTANNDGTAEVSFPFKIPAGRAGMQPQLGLQYNSSGNGSWTGFGWGLSVPNISVDVTWGVPHYYSDKESETYIMGGTQLTPVAHRSEYVARTAEKRFYPRVEGGFNKVIRHGDNPTNYWWEVTAKNGSKSFYGGLPETGIVANAVTTDANGNIGNWALTQLRDLHDNFVNYSYEKPTECGQQLYISEITYTGHGTEPGLYKVTFLRNDDANTYIRKDARINAKLGFIQRDNALLRRINITYNNETIRSYTLQYKDGAFFKTLLESVTELDATGKEFYSHKFDYYDDVQASKGYVPFKDEKTWALDDDKVQNPFLNPLNMFFDKVSALGGSGSAGGGGKLTLTVGPNAGALKDITVGGNVSYNGSTGKGLLAIVDINGDGLPDKVYKKGDKVYYRPNIQSDKLYGDEHEIKGIDNFSLSKTNGFGWGLEANPPFSYVGYDHAKNKTKTEIYFTDFNGDGLTDIAKKGVVYFNHIDENGEPVFEQSSFRTPNPLNGNSTIDPSLLPNSATEQAELEERFPLHDAVRMWQAPYSGSIIIKAPVQLLQDTCAEAVADTMKDGVIVSIQNNNTVLWRTQINANDFGIKTHPDLGVIPVSKNQRIFFRVQSLFNGTADKVSWDPEINYTHITDPDVDTLITWVDVNGKKISHYKASEDFTLNGAQSVGLSKEGILQITSTFSKPLTTDSLKLEVIKTDSSNNQTILLSRDYSYGQSVTNDPINLSYAVIKNDNLSFRVISSTNIDWSKIKWDIYLKYSSFNDGSPVTNYLGKPMFDFKPAAEFTKMFNDPVKHVAPVLADTAFMFSLGLDSIDPYPHHVKINPKVHYNAIVDFGINDTVIVSVKTQAKLLAKKMYLIRDNAIVGNDSISANITLGDSLFFEYHGVNHALISRLDTAMVIINNDPKKNMHKASISYIVDPNQEIFGHLYRGWGQFDYNGNGERANQGLILTELKINDENLTNNATNITDTAGLEGTHNPTGDIFNIAVPYVNTSGYMGTDEKVYITGESMSSSRIGLKNVYVEPYSFTESSSSGLPALNKISIEKSNSFSLGINGFGAGLSGSKSTSDVYFETDMADMNGDGYPDLLSDGQIQYTSVLGGLKGQAINHGLGTHKASADAMGASLGGNNITAKCINTLVSKVVKSDKKGTQTTQQNDQKSKSAEKTAEVSVGLNASFSTNKDNNTETWMDINGDGLPDKIKNDGTVWLNLGYSFAPAENWAFSGIREGKSEDFGLGGSLGVSIKNKSIAGGIGLSKTTNEATKEFLDVNADGLPDMVQNNTVRFNTGSGFSEPITWSGLGSLDAGESVGESANLAFTISFRIWLIKICVNPSGSVSRGISRTNTQLSDMDGDGMPDVLYSEKEGELKIKSSTINRTNMLKTVHRPMGSNFSMDYIQTPATYKHPGGSWALASVKAFDGFVGDGVDSTVTTFEYENGFYNRREHQFYGFASVKTHFHDTGNKSKIYRTLEQKFSNSDYYTKGMMLSETLTDGVGNKQTGSENIYALRNIHTGQLLPEIFSQSDSIPAFVSLDESKHYLYEGASSPKITTRESYGYDMMGNISRYTDHSTGNEKDKVDVSIAYHSNEARYLHSVPSKQEVFTQEGLMRRRETIINDFGDITQINQLITDGQNTQFNMEYDEYGNLTKIIHPANYKGERLWYAYEYDQVVHSFVTKITDAYGYSSSSSYDYKWSAPIQNIDKNNQKMQYTFDDCGRSKTITGPYEVAAGKPYTIAFDYHPEATIPYAHTLHYDSIFNSDIETYTFTDGMGRPLQVKKTASLFTNAKTSDTPGFIVSGKAVYDAFGRTTEAFQPVFEASTSPTTYNATPDNIKPTLTTYDVLDRTIKITLPDGAKTNRTYGIGNYNGETIHIDTLTDALNHKATICTDNKGQQLATIINSSSGDITTSFKFNAIGELLSVTDPKGNKTLSVYDKLGRRTSVSQPDAGLTEFTYDAAGNIIKKITANLRQQIPNGGAITYNYDRERLVEIVYPRNIQNRVNYTYGAPGAAHNRAGRIELVQDASGGQEFFYGPLGEVIKTIRTVQLGESDMRTWIWSASYDTWNRIQYMTYPDGEKVTYNYNRAGNLIEMDGEKLGRAYPYISRIGYDKYEKQVYLQYGNGSVTTYNYEPERQRLAQMSVTSNNKELMSNTYKYDVLNNILGITNSAAANGDIGGSSSHAYSYDDLNRLTQASGTFSGNKDTSNYSLSMTYDVMGNILHKTQTHNKNNEKQTATTYDFGYKYDGLKPNAASKIGDRLFTYDENGNQTSWEDTVTNDFRQLSWDEENRLSLISDNGYLNRYVYDESGERVIKSHGGSQGVYINGAPAGIVNHSDNNYTVYVSPYFVLQNERFTKHYYAGSNRITSKIGNGQFENQYRLGVFEITAGGVNYINRQQQILTGKKEFEKQLGIPPGPPTMKGIYADPAYSGKAYPDVGTPDTLTPRGWPQKPVFAPVGGPPGAPIQWGDNVTNDNVESGFGYVGNGNIEEDLRYFYHSDHLGSTSYVTNAKGEITQFIAYMPFGETLAEQHSDWDSPYKFNAKELDIETGLYYYGARYYDPKISIWLGVDPMAEDFYSVSPYSYCTNNPVVMVDPNGESPTLITAAIGFGVGALIGGAIEIGTQLYKNGSVNNWKAVGGSALQGGITGGVAGLTGGASLLTTVVVSGGANVVGGTVNRTIQGKETTLADVTLDFTIGAVIGAAAKYIPTPKGAGSVKGGSWVTTNESMSIAASKYQTLITGQAANKSFLLKGVKFDGVLNNILIDAKSGYGNFVNKSTGTFYSWFRGAKSLVSQAERQIEAANGTKIQWFFENKSAMDATQKLFKDEGIKGIELIYKATN